MKQTARIDDWIDCGTYLIGKVTLHPRQEQFGLNMQQTSSIVSRPARLVEGSTVQTEYTTYILGKPFAVANDEEVVENYGGTD